MEIAAVKDLVGEAAFSATEVVISRCYDVDQRNLWNVTVDETAAVKHLVQNSALHAEEKSGLAAIENVADLKQHLVQLGMAATERHRQLAQHLSTSFARGSGTLAVIDLLNGHMPKFVYFSQYDLMPGQVSLNELLGQRQHKKFRVFTAFLEVAKISIEDVQQIKTFESLIARLEAASIGISREIFKFWSQNRHLKVEVRVDEAQSGDPPPFNTGKVVRLRIRNTLHEVTVSFDDRSTGFRLVFLVPRALLPAEDLAGQEPDRTVGRAGTQLAREGTSGPPPVHPRTAEAGPSGPVHHALAIHDPLQTTC